LIAKTALRAAGVLLFLLAAACGSISNPTSPPNDFSSGNFSVTIVASSTCSTLPDVAQNRSWKMGLVKTGSDVVASIQGSSGPGTVFTQTSLAGTAAGSSLMLNGWIYDTVDGCTPALCYQAEGRITATQSGNVINGTLNGVLTYDAATCQASDHKVTFTRQ
jgi:hypothetical protein